MNVLHLSSQDFAGGGGGFAAGYRLHNNLRSAGCNSRMIVGCKKSDDPDVYLVRKSVLRRLTSTLAKAANAVKIRKRNHDYFFTCDHILQPYSARGVLKNVGFVPDIIIAHWISGFLTARELRDLGELCRAPVLWHMLDMAPLTGGCHYAWDCDRYSQKCGKCPAIFSASETDPSRDAIAAKCHYFRAANITAVAPSEWLFRQAKKASTFRGKRIEKIMLGIDSNIFHPVSKEVARSQLGLPLEKRILFFGAHRMDEKRKGMPILLDALRSLVRAGLTANHLLIVTAGREDSFGPLVGRALAHRHIGLLRGDKELAWAYQAADAYICPSIEDSGPMMINEAIMCGTPVVSFEMGVAVDLVHSGVTGYRARLGDTEGLAKGILTILKLSTDQWSAVSSQCRKLAIRLCHPDVQTASFTRLFLSLCDSENKGVSKVSRLERRC